MKRVVTIQDISCIGKCSLTTALPILSAAGIETAVIPTAVLSAHTAFDSFTFHDMTDEITKISDDWKNHKLSFDGIYTGYLGSVKQLEIVSDFIDSFKAENTLTVIDPVMGDHGKLYSGFTTEFSANMKGFCKKADIIVPNLTEAAFLTDTEYLTNYNENDIRELLKRLSGLCDGISVLTGISFDNKQLGIMSYNPNDDSYFKYFGKKSPETFHGTGDIFAGSLCGALINDIPLNEALKTAVDFTLESIHLTLSDKKHVWYGVNFEQALPFYIESLKQAGK